MRRCHSRPMRPTSASLQPGGGCRIRKYSSAYIRTGVGLRIGGIGLALTSRRADFGHASAVDEAHLPLDNHSLPFLHSRPESGTITFDRDDLNHPHLRLLVGVCDEDEWPTLAALNRNRRDQRSLWPDIEIDFDIDIHARPQFQAFVGKDGFGGNGSSV